MRHIHPGRKASTLPCYERSSVVPPMNRPGPLPESPWTGALMTPEVSLSNNLELIKMLNRATTCAEQALRAAGRSDADPQAQAEAFEMIVNAISQLDQRIVAIEEKLKP